MREPNIVWIASYPKSGNTWLRLFLHAYVNGSLDINAMPLKSSDLYVKHYEAVSPVPLKDIPKDETLFLRTAALYRYFNTQERTFLKTHCANVIANHIELIPRLFTERVIYLVRDPRDVAVSYSYHVGENVDETIKAMGMDMTIWQGGLPHYLGTWSNHVRSWINTTGYPVLVVRYEDMLANPKKVFSNIVKFLGTYDEKRLEDAIEMTLFKNLKKQEEEKGFNERPKASKQFFRQGKTGQWKDLKPFQIKRIETEHGEMMKEVGYEV